MASNDIGIKISQPGWDVSSAGDANLYFSSSWPILKIESTDTIQITSNTDFSIKHDLQYPPLAFLWSPNVGLTPLQSTSRLVTLPFPSANYAGEMVTYFIFRLPLNVAYQSPVIKATPQPPGGSNIDFALKFVKQGKDINSNDFRDFTIHSSARSPLLHAVITSKVGPIDKGTFAGVTGLKWTPDLPYRPVFFAYYSADNEVFVPVSTAGQVPPKANYDDIDNGILVNAASLTGYGSIVLLKDPLDFLTRTTVNI